MAKNQEIEFDQTAANNTDAGGINTAEGWAAADVNNAFRYLMKARADAISRHVAKSVGSYTAVKTDHNQFWRCTGAVTITLTAAATLTSGWCLWVRANGGAVTIDPDGTEQINGSATSMVLTDGQFALIVCTGTAFFSVAFSHPGIDDQMSAQSGNTRLTIQGSRVMVGSSTAATDYVIERLISDGTLLIGGSNGSTGGRVKFYGSTHATQAHDIELSSSAGVVYFYDSSAAKHSIVGEFRFAQDTTSIPGAGNNTVGAAISNAGVIYGSAAAPHQFNRTTDAVVCNFNSGGTTQGTISIAGATTSYNPFFGSHWSRLSDKSQPEILRGTICETIDELSEFEERIGDRLPKFKISDEEGSNSVYGVFHTWDSEVAGRAEIGALGAYFVRIAADVTVKRGDLIESNGDGCGRVQRSRHFLASTVAKVTAAVVIEVYPDGSYRVPCTLHCG
jgi:hypothetical protein